MERPSPPEPAWTPSDGEPAEARCRGTAGGRGRVKPRKRRTQPRPLWGVRGGRPPRGNSDGARRGGDSFSGGESYKFKWTLSEASGDSHRNEPSPRARGGACLRGATKLSYPRSTRGARPFTSN